MNKKYIFENVLKSIAIVLLILALSGCASQEMVAREEQHYDTEIRAIKGSDPFFSGQHHSYRGVLGIIGADMKRVWEKITDRLVDRGYLERETAQGIRMDLLDEIKSVG